MGKCLPADKEVRLLGDGEFDSIELQSFCREVGWDYALRTACNTVKYEQNDRFQPKNLFIPDGIDFLFIPNVDFTKERFRKSTSFVGMTLSMKNLSQ